MNLENLDKDKLVLAVISIIFVSITLVGALYTPLEWDEGAFLTNAEYLQGDKSNFEESRPMAISYLISTVWEFTGENTITARALIIFSGLMVLYGFRELADEEFEDTIPLVSVLALSPLMLYWSWHVYTDIPAMFFVISSIYFYRKEKPLHAGIQIAVAATFRYVFLVFGFGIAAAYLIENRSQLNRYLKGGFAGSIPLLFYSYIAHGNPLAKVYMYVGRVSRWSGSGPLAATLGNISSFIQMISTLIPGIFFGWKESPLVEKTMLISYSLFMIIFSGNTFNRYWLAVLPIVLLISYRGLDKKIFYVASIFMILISGSAVAESLDNQSSCMRPLEESLEYAGGLEGHFVSEWWSLASYRLDQKVNSPWAGYERLHNEKGVNYAISSKKADYEIVKSFSSDCITYNIYNLSAPK